MDFLAILVVVVLGYFFPTIIAASRSHHQTGMVAVLNIFLGWTFIGWVVALAISCGSVKRA